MKKALGGDPNNAHCV